MVNLCQQFPKIVFVFYLYLFLYLYLIFVSVFKSVFLNSQQFAKIVPALEEFEHSLRMRSVSDIWMSMVILRMRSGKYGDFENEVFGWKL